MEYMTAQEQKKYTIAHSAYMTEVFGDRYGTTSQGHFKKKVQAAARRLKKLDFDFIIMRGVSGITFGSALCYCLGKFPVVVRKDGEGTHSAYKVEGLPENVIARAIIVDDFVDTGKTMVDILRTLEKFKSDSCHGVDYEILGAYLYERQLFVDDIVEYMKSKAESIFSNPQTKKELERLKKETEYASKVVKIERS